MSETKDLYAAKLDEFELAIETIDDSLEKAIARHEFPYRDGAMLDDLGQKARTVKIRCYWYDETYDRHKEFLQHLKKKERYELLHPKYGVMKGAVESVSIRHNDRLKTAEVDVSFVEELIVAAEPQRQVQVERSTEEAFASGQFELVEEFDADMVEALGPEGLELMELELPADVGSLLDELDGLSTGAREYIAELDAYRSELMDMLPDIDIPFSSVLNAVKLPSTISGLVTGALSGSIDRYVSLFGSLRGAPVLFLASLRSALAGLVPGFPQWGRQTRIAAAQRTGLEMAYIYHADEQRRVQVRKLEKVPSFDVLGNYMRPGQPEPLMSMNDIEQTLADARTDLQTAVNESRTVGSLKTIALNLLVHVQETKLERDRIVTVDLDHEMPLHLICLRYGLPHAYAERINSINRIKHPSFTQPGQVNLYAR